jgi:prepilin-type N-terminal cleavage/methylation domain-containing protein
LLTKKYYFCDNGSYVWCGDKILTNIYLLSNNMKKGFTLIELLVVIAIISPLSSVILASLNTARAKGRDAKRLADFKQLQSALELYYDDNNSYPGTDGQWMDIDGCDPLYDDMSTYVTPTYISSVASDPIAGNCNKWYQKNPNPATNGEGYKLIFIPEQASLLTQDQDCYLIVPEYYCLGINPTPNP